MPDLAIHLVDIYIVSLTIWNNRIRTFRWLASKQLESLVYAEASVDKLRKTDDTYRQTQTDI